MDTVEAVMTIEGGEAGPEKIMEAWAHLIKTGVVWQLQGFYQRGAHQLIRAGWISPEGEILSPVESSGNEM